MLILKLRVYRPKLEVSCYLVGLESRELVHVLLEFRESQQPFPTVLLVSRVEHHLLNLPSNKTNQILEEQNKMKMFL